MKGSVIRTVIFMMSALALFSFGAMAYAASGGTGTIGDIASQAKTSLSGIAQLITAGAYVAGMGFAVAAVAGFKAHKDNPTQSPISKPIALLFVGASLLFIPSVFESTGATLFGESGQQAGILGITSF